jgi:mono/diheme cytochrome c family protein
MRQLIIAALIALSPAAAFAAPMGGDSSGSPAHSVIPADGEGVYRAICQACHMKDGKGGTGAGTIPALAANPRLGSASYVITMAAQGRGAMPGFVEMLSPAQISAVAGYVCTHFGNSCKGDTSPAAVKTLIAGVKHRPAP